MASPKTLFTINAAALALGRDRRTLVVALRDIKPDANTLGRQKRYKLRTIFDALLRHETRGLARPGKITDEHLLLARARREKIELELAEQAGQLSHIDTVCDVIEEQYRNTREFFLSVPGSCGNDLASIARKAENELTAAILVSERLRQILHQAMEEWSTPKAVVARAHARHHGRREVGEPEKTEDAA